MSDRPTGRPPAQLKAVLGPTNTGKTHLAVERMLGHESGMIGLPLRLLAREVYDRIAKARGPRSVALITGEEKIVPPNAKYFVCTVAAMPLNREVEFLAVDEVQLAADPERGHVFTHRLLHARGLGETMLLGSDTMAPLIKRLAPQAEFQNRERFSSLSYSGPQKLTRLPRRSAIVAFSADAVYAIAELIRRQRGGAAVVMGALSPRTRNAQVALYQSGEVDFLVATDAIGMGLNMDVDHVAFAGLRKHDGKRTRWLHAQEIGQIAGRAGRYRTDGTFGVTGDCPEIDPDLVAAVENHRFDPVEAAEWRSARLDFHSLAGLMRSLSAPPDRPGLKLSAEALDETSLRRLAQSDQVQDLCRNPDNLRLLWEVCQTPDFRKASLDEHLRLLQSIFGQLATGARRVPEDWIEGQYRSLDRLDGDIDTLAGRLSRVRTLAYVANRPDWLRDPAHWQGRTRQLEDRLSDTLHEKLMQRFIDRRTSGLMRGLRVRGDVLAGVAPDGAVTVEGHYVGRLRGATFEAAQGSSTLEDKALRAAAQRAVAPEVARRLGQLAADADSAFALQPDGLALWRGEGAGQVAGCAPFSARVRLFGELGPEVARERAARRLEAFVVAEAGRSLGPLRRLDDAVADGRVKGLARGIAYRLIEASGIIDRRSTQSDVKALSQSERRALRSLGVRIGAFSIYLPSLLGARARRFQAAFAGAGHWRPPHDKLSPLPSPAPAPKVLAAHGLRAVGRHAVPVDALERLDELLRSAPRQGGASVLADQAIEELGWTSAEAGEVMRALGFVPVGHPAAGQAGAWRQRRDRSEPEARSPKTAGSPFAALAALKPAPPRRHRRPPRKRARA